MFTLAKQIQGQFETRKRHTREPFVALKDGSPDWMKDLCYQAHGGDDNWMMPDDWRYRFIAEAVDAIVDAGADATDSEYSDVVGNIEADIYTCDLLLWLSSKNSRYSYVDDARSEYGTQDSIIKEIAIGQILEKQEVLFSVLNFLREQSDSYFNGHPADEE